MAGDALPLQVATPQTLTLKSGRPGVFQQFLFSIPAAVTFKVSVTPYVGHVEM